MSQSPSTELEIAKKPLDTPGSLVLIPAIGRLGVPVGIFGITFFLIAITLTLVFSPDRFPVRVGDKTVRLHELEAEEKSLKLTQVDLMKERQKILADADAPVLDQIAKLRTQTVPVGSAMLAVENVRWSFHAGMSDPISLPTVTFDAAAHTLMLGGDVRDAAGRSMQILATFIDELRALPNFESVSEPEYLSEPLPDGGTVSRFSLILRFPHE